MIESRMWFNKRRIEVRTTASLAHNGVAVVRMRCHECAPGTPTREALVHVREFDLAPPMRWELVSTSMLATRACADALRASGCPHLGVIAAWRAAAMLIQAIRDELRGAT